MPRPAASWAEVSSLSAFWRLPPLPLEPIPLPPVRTTQPNCLLAIPRAEDILSASARSLLQQTQCPDHCKSGACALDRATNSYKCNDCITSMVVDRASGQCGG